MKAVLNSMAIVNCDTEGVLSGTAFLPLVRHVIFKKSVKSGTVYSGTSKQRNPGISEAFVLMFCLILFCSFPRELF